jgi:hypothetical protein
MRGQVRAVRFLVDVEEVPGASARGSAPKAAAAEAPTTDEEASA